MGVAQGRPADLELENGPSHPETGRGGFAWHSRHPFGQPADGSPLTKCPKIMLTKSCSPLRSGIPDGNCTTLLNKVRGAECFNRGCVSEKLFRDCKPNLTSSTIPRGPLPLSVQSISPRHRPRSRTPLRPRSRAPLRPRSPNLRPKVSLRHWARNNNQR